MVWEVIMLEMAFIKALKDLLEKVGLDVVNWIWGMAGNCEGDDL